MGAHVAEEAARTLRQPLHLPVDELVGSLRETFDRFVVERRPMSCEAMIGEHVDENRCAAP